MSLEDQGASILADETASEAAPVKSATPAAKGEGVKAEAQPAEAVETLQAEAPEAWWKGMTSGLDNSEQLTFRNMASRYKEPKDFAKAHIELRKQAIIVPADDKPEAWNQVFDRLGRPKEAKDYALDFGDAKLDDGEKDLAENFKTIAHREGLLPRQVKALTKWQAEIKKTQTDAYVAKAQSLHSERERLVKAEWGQDYTAKRGAVVAALKSNTNSQQFSELARSRLDDGTYVCDHPAWANFLATIGEKLTEDSRDPMAFNTAGKESVQSEISRIESEALQKGLTPVSPNWPHAQLNKLYDRLYGTKPIAMGFGAR